MIFLRAAAELESFLGDPSNPASPISYTRQLAEDEHDAFPAHAVGQLDTWELYRFYVPAHHAGGKLKRIDEALYVLRAVSRRDLTAAIGHAKTFLGAAAVWVAGSPAIQARCAGLILDKKPVALGLTEVEHGSDLVHNACCLTSAPNDSYRLSGEKWLINNATRSAALTVYANLADVAGARAGTLVWVEKDKIGSPSYACLAKEYTHGIRGADISGIRFDNAPLQASDIIGVAGGGLEATLKSLQLSRTLCCALSTGAADSAIRAMWGFSRLRTLYGAPLEQHPYLRHRMVNAFTMQLVAECMSLTASRMFHVLPGEMSVVSSVVKYFIPGTVESIFDIAESTIGARAYLREQEFAFFQKAKRDQRLVSLFDGSSVVNLQAIALQLKQIAVRTLAPPAPGSTASLLLEQRTSQVFDLDAPLPELDFAKLSLSSRGQDTLMQYLLHVLLPASDAISAAFNVSLLIRKLADAVRELLTFVTSELADKDLRDPEWFDAARKYCSLYAAVCCFQVWNSNRNSAEIEFDPAFRDGAWLIHAIAWLLGEPGRDDNDGELCSWLQNLVQEQRAISILPMSCPHSLTWGEA